MEACWQVERMRAKRELRTYWPESDELVQAAGGDSKNYNQASS